MSAPLRVIDTGLNPARWNVAMTAAMIELHRAGEIPDTLRFHVYPRSVLIGRHQALGRAVDAHACRRRKIELARRVTGGGAVYMSPGVLAWDLLVARRAVGKQLGAAAAHICGAVAAGLSRLGLAARYRALNEIEIGGRKVSGASGCFDGPSLVYQGTILVDPDLNEMAEVLSLPAARPAAALGERLVALKEVLGRVPDDAELRDVLAAGISDFLSRPLVREGLADEERRLAEAFHAGEIGSDDFVEGVDVLPAGATIVGRQAAPDSCIEAHIRTHPGADRRIEQIWLTGDFSVTPARTIPDLEAALRGLPVLDAPVRALDFLSGEPIELRGATRFDIAAAIADAAMKSGQKSKTKPRGRRP